MPAISVLMKPASGMCNMTCAYCFYCDESSKRDRQSYGFMAEETLKNVIRKTMPNATGLISYAYQGGEPSLRGLDFFEKAVYYQNKYNRNGVKVYNAFQTNGFAMDEAWCRFFKQHHFLVGLSVDGTKSTHDLYRHDKEGNGTYERVINAARLMDQHGLDYNILTVVNKNVAAHITEIYQDYKRRGWGYQQYIACLDPLYEEHGKNKYSILPEHYGRFLTELFELWYQDWKRGKAPYIRQFDNYISIIKGYIPESCDQRGTCGIQNVIEADGSVYPCDFYMLDEYCVGNFNTNRFSEIEDNRTKIGFIEESRKLNPKCRACRHYKLCKGGCQRHRDRSPDSDYYENYFCEGYQLFFEQCYGKLTEVVGRT